MKLFLSIILSVFICFNSCLSNSYALTVGTSLATLRAIGYAVSEVLGFYYTAIGVIDLGYDLWCRMDDNSKEIINNNVWVDDNGDINVNDIAKDVIVTNVNDFYPPRDYHLIYGHKFKLNLDYHPGSYNGNHSLTSYAANKFSESPRFAYGSGMPFSYTAMVFKDYSPSDHRKAYFVLGLNGEKISSRYYTIVGMDFVYDVTSDFIQNFEDAYYIINNSKSMTVSLDGINTYNITLREPYFESSCSNCPHDTLYNKDNYPNSISGVTKEEEDYIKQQYPNLNILPPSEKPSGGDNGSDNPSFDLSPPSFPNLEDFNFSSINFESLGNLFNNFKSKFPFSIPFDIFNIIDSFSCEPIAPVFDIPIFSETLQIDLTEFEELANIIRMFVIVGWVFVLFSFTKKFGE